MTEEQPKKHDLFDIMITVQEQAMRCEAQSLAHFAAGGGWRRRGREEQERAEKLYAAAAALEFVTYDPEGFRKWCREIGKRRGGRGR